MTVTASPLVPANTQIDSVEDLWEPSVLFLPNWEREVQIGTSYRTVLQASRSQSEQRYILAEKPRRSMTYRLRSYSSPDSERVRAFLGRASRARIPMPLWPDVTLPVGRKSVASDIYVGDFTNRRFQVGARMCALVEETPGISVDFKYSKIISVSDTELEIEDNLNEAYDNGLKLRFESHQFLDPISRFLWSTQGPLFGGPGPRSPFAASEGDIVICCFAFTTFQSVSTPISVTGIEAVDSDDPSHTAVIPIVVNLEHPGNPSGPTLEPKTMVVGYWKIPPSFDGKQYHIVFTTDGDQLAHPRMTVTSWRSALDLSTALVQATGTISAAPDFQNIEVTVDPEMAKNRIISFHFSGASGRGFLNHSPAAARLMWFNNFGSGDTSTQFATLDHEAPDGSPLVMGMEIGFDPGVNEQEGYMAAAVVLQQKEDPGLSTGQFYPVIETDLELDNKANTLTDSVNDASMTVVETPGTSSLDPEIVPGTTPAGYDTYQPLSGSSYPILHLPIDWRGVQTGIFRVGKRDRVGITTALQVFGSNPGAIFKLPFVELDREDAFNLLEFFDSRGGRAFPFWLFSPSPILEVLEIGVLFEVIHLKPSINERDWELYRYIGVLDKTTGVRTGHEISSVTLSASPEEIRLIITPPLPDDVVSRYEFTTAHLCRLDKDGLDERWITNVAQRTSLPVRELINEDVIPVTLESFCGPGGGISWFPDNVCDPCTDFRCGTDDAGGCCICAEAGVTAIVFCYDAPCLEDSGGYGPCEFVTAHVLGLDFQFCDTGPNGVGFIRWATIVMPPMEGVEVWVELNYLTATWTTNIAAWIINLDCSGLVPSKGICVPGVLCDDMAFPPIFTHSCLQFTESFICGLQPQCFYRTFLAVSGSGIMEAHPVCA